MTTPSQRPALRPRVRTPATPAPAVPVTTVSTALLRRRRPAADVAGTERTVWEDETGRRFTVLVPVGHPEDAALGMVVGPPVFDGLSLPEAVAVRVHNELHDRGLLTAHDLRGREVEVYAVLQAALRVDAGLIIGAYRAE